MTTDAIAFAPPKIGSNVVEVMKAAKQLAAMERPRRKFSVSFLRNYSAEYIDPFLRCHFLAAGLQPELWLGGFDTVAQDVLSSEFRSRHHDMVVLSLTLDRLAPDFGLPGAPADDVVAKIEQLAGGVRDATTAPLVINTFLPPCHGETGLLRPGSLQARIAGVNAAIRALAADKNFILVDFEHLAARVGLLNSLNPRTTYLAEAPFRDPFLDAYGNALTRVARGLAGQVKKVVAVDCDGTLWGGVIGEAGLDGIQLDANSFPGRAYRDFHKSLLRLAERGALIVLCSKNEEQDVMEVLGRHPDCLLKREHIIAHRINWLPKEENIRSLAAELNLGLDSFVFVDDSDTECARVASFLPEVTVRQVPSQISDLPDLLEVEGLFDGLSTSREDAERTELYRTEARRKEHATTFATVEDFLASLNLRAAMGRMKPAEAPRVAQLCQKTNQFNLTTRRYSEGEIRELGEDPNAAIFCLTPEDRFGRFGLTGVLIARREGDEARIALLLMSCRILGRSLEYAFAAFCLSRLAEEWGMRRCHAAYLPTAKNHQVADFWDSVGFTASVQEGGSKQYTAATEQLRLSLPSYIEVIDA